MAKSVDLTGKRFSRLVAIEPTKERKRKSIVWKCACDCGNKINVSCKDLVGFRVKSCGCLLSENMRIYNAENREKIENARGAHDGTVECTLNKTIRKDNTSGVRGVYKKNNGRYVARIKYKGKQYNLGTFWTLKDAKEARKIAEKEIWGKDLE